MKDSLIESICQEYAGIFGVPWEVHDSDFIFNFVLNSNTDTVSLRKRIEYYYSDASSSAEKLSKLLYRDLGLTRNKTYSILEFASGYGCVTRHLQKSLPNFHITACDIHKEAMSFISEKIGVDTRLSVPDPLDFHNDQKYDVVFALSFFSHIPKKRWSEWLVALYNNLLPGGVLIFTTHGTRSLSENIKPDAEGFFFAPISEQYDLDTNEYGNTVSLPRFVFDKIFKNFGDGCLSYFQQGFWWSHQDVYVVSRR